jgi:hypothetical protein
MAGSLLSLQITDPVSSGKIGKNVSHECERAYRYQFFAAEAPCILISYIFWLKLLKPNFCDLKSKFSLNKKIKYQRFNVK